MIVPVQTFASKTMLFYVRRAAVFLRQNVSISGRNEVLAGTNNGLRGQLVSRSAVTKKTEKPGFTKRYGRLVGLGFGFGVCVGGVYMYDLYKKITTPLANPSAGGEYVLEKEPPTFTASRAIQIPTDTTGLKITLFQYQTCPFCCKVRAFLDYYGFSYDVIEVNSVTRTQTKWTDYRKVPFLVVKLPNSDTVLQLKDSTMIISVLQSFLDNKSEGMKDLVKFYPTMHYTDEQGDKRMEIMNRYFLMYGKHPPGRTKEDIVDERKWRKWVDDVYVHVLSPNVYRTPTESLQAFHWFSKVGNWEEYFATWERLLVVYVGSAAMYLIGKNLKRRHQLKDDVRQSFYEQTNVFLKALKKKGTNYLGGDSPNLADLAVYGVLTAVEGCEAFQDVRMNTNISLWFDNMGEVVRQHSGAPHVAEKASHL